jgi:hypothetical protein
MLIQNYGLHWHRSKIKFGAGRNKGALLGKKAGAKRSKPTDFRKQIGVYILYDSNFRIVYVGQAGRGNADLFSRLKQHRNDHLAQRWTLFSWFGLFATSDGELNTSEAEKTVSNLAALNHIEAILIATTEPPLNLQGGKFKSDGTEQYIQFVEEDEGYDEE